MATRSKNWKWDLFVGVVKSEHHCLVAAAQSQRCCLLLVFQLIYQYFSIVKCLLESYCLNSKTLPQPDWSVHQRRYKLSNQPTSHSFIYRKKNFSQFLWKFNLSCEIFFHISLFVALLQSKLQSPPPSSTSLSEKENESAFVGVGSVIGAGGCIFFEENVKGSYFWFIVDLDDDDGRLNCIRYGGICSKARFVRWPSRRWFGALLGIGYQESAAKRHKWIMISVTRFG